MFTKFYSTLILTMLLLLGCTQDITVEMEEGNGAITGHVEPNDSGALVKLYQGGLIKETNIDNEGYFRLNDIAPGIYSIEVEADSFATYTIGEIEVNANETTNIRDIVMNILPAPLSNIGYDIFWNNVDLNYVVNIDLYFTEYVEISALESAISFTPEIENVEFQAYSYKNNIEIEFVGMIDTEYTMNISEFSTINGNSLEFPYEYDFSVPSFKIVDYGIDNHYLDTSIDIEFNSSVKLDNILDYVSISEPVDLMFMATNSNHRVEFYTNNGFPSNTEISLGIASGLTDILGNPLDRNYEITFITNPLMVRSTIPENYTYGVNVNSSIRIAFNNYIDASNPESFLDFSPEIDYTYGTDISYNQCNLDIFPDSLASGTTYEITINTNLNDLYGIALSQPYSFSFVTETE